MMAGKLQRAALLQERRRYDEALAVLAEILVHDPECAEAHYQKTWNLLEIPGRKLEALEAVNAAIAIDPEDADYMAGKAVVLSQLNREKEALAVAEEAVAMDPDLAMAWIAKAQALGGQGRWPEAEQAIRKALEIEPDDTTAANLLSHYLRMQNRLESSDEEVRRRLAKDAEDPFSLANAGWVALQSGDHAKAEEFFREALRVDPELEYARSGLLEAYKARSLFYRIYLKWVFFLQKYSDKNQLIILISIYLVYRFARGILSTVHPALGIGLGLLYLLFAFGSWIASGIGHFIILKDPVARLALNPPEKRDAWAVGGAFALGLLLILGGISLGPLSVAVAGAVVLASAVPASRIFLNDSSAGRLIFGVITLAIYASAVVIVMTGDYTPAIWAALLCFGSTWLALIPGLQRESY